MTLVSAGHALTYSFNRGVAPAGKEQFKPASCAARLLHKVVGTPQSLTGKRRGLTAQYVSKSRGM